MSVQKYLRVPPTTTGALGDGWGWTSMTTIESPFQKAPATWDTGAATSHATKGTAKTEGDYEQLFEVTAKASGELLGQKASGAVSFLRSRKGTQLDVHCVGRQFIVVGDEKLDEKNASLKEAVGKKRVTAQDAEEFVERYGTTCVTSVRRGGIFLYDYRFSSTTMEAKNKFSTELDVVLAAADGATGDKAKAEFHKAIKGLLKSSGGRVAQSAEPFFAGPSVDMSEGDVTDHWFTLSTLQDRFRAAVEGEGQEAFKLSFETTPWHLISKVTDGAEPAFRQRLKEMCIPPVTTRVARLSEAEWKMERTHDVMNDLTCSEMLYGANANAEKKKLVRADQAKADQLFAEASDWATLKTAAGGQLLDRCFAKLDDAQAVLQPLLVQVTPPTRVHGTAVGSATWGGNGFHTQQAALKAIAGGSRTDKDAGKKLNDWGKDDGSSLQARVKLRNGSSSWMKLESSLAVIDGRMVEFGNNELPQDLPDVILPGQIGCWLMVNRDWSRYGPQAAAQYKLHSSSGAPMYLCIAWDVSDTGTNGVDVSLSNKRKDDKALKKFANGVGTSLRKTVTEGGLRLKGSCGDGDVSTYTYTAQWSGN